MSDNDKGFLILLLIVTVVGMSGGAGYALIKAMPLGRVIGYALAGFAAPAAILLILFVLGVLKT